VTQLESWHALLAPLPDAAAPLRKPVATPDVLASPEGAAIAGWEQLTLHLSAGQAGLRILLVVLDASSRPVAASDHVLFWSPGQRPSDPRQIRQESIGGRLEPDGTFRGTCWVVAGPEPANDDPPQWDSTSRPPTAAESAAFLGLVDQLVARAP
jgi:hypothetical protein